MFLFLFFFLLLTGFWVLFSNFGHYRTQLMAIIGGYPRLPLRKWTFCVLCVSGKSNMEQPIKGYR